MVGCAPPGDIAHALSIRDQIGGEVAARFVCTCVLCIYLYRSVLINAYKSYHMCNFVDNRIRIESTKELEKSWQIVLLLSLPITMIASHKLRQWPPH